MMEFLVGVCTGAALVLLAVPIFFNLLPLLLRVLGFCDAALNPRIPAWYARLRRSVPD